MDVEKLSEELELLKERFNGLLEVLATCNLKSDVDLSYLMEENEDEFSDEEEDLDEGLEGDLANE